MTVLRLKDSYDMHVSSSSYLMTMLHLKDCRKNKTAYSRNKERKGAGRGMAVSPAEAWYLVVSRIHVI